MNEHFISGEWSGFYIENHRTQRGWMHLYLGFENGIIRGEGTDYVGPWVADGSYDEKSRHCSWTKRYVGAHSVRYSGKCSENGIQGEWAIISTGPFHIWPKTHPHFNELYLQQEMDHARESVPSILLESVSGGDLI